MSSNRYILKEAQCTITIKLRSLRSDDTISNIYNLNINALQFPYSQEKILLDN